MDYFSDLEGWKEYPQSPHTNQLKQLSESMEYTPKADYIRHPKKHCFPNIQSLKNYTEEKSPRARKIRTKRPSEILECYFQQESPLRERKPKGRSPEGKLNITTHEHKFNLITEGRDSSLKPLIPRNKLQKLAPILQKVHRVHVRNRVVTLNHKSPINQLTQLLQLLNSK